MELANLQNSDPRATAEVVRRAAEVFAAGGLVIFPTETVYGIGAAAAHDRGYEALRNAKGRPDDQPFTLHIPTARAAELYADLASPRLRRFVGKVFPGPVTLVVDVSDDQIAQSLARLGLPAWAADRLYHHNTVGLRCPDHPLARQVLGAVEGPVVASSANLRGQRPPRDCAEAAQALGDRAGLVIDGGPCQYAKPSTVIQIRAAGPAGSTPTIRVLREGVYDERTIRRLLRWNVLMVCSGNTCRSPLAEALARRQLAQARGIATDELEAAGLFVASAGVAAADGMPASSGALAAGSRLGLDLARHRSRSLTRDMIHQADLILCMTRSHVQAVLDLEPLAAERGFPLDPAADVEDPIGCGTEDYVRCAQRIDQALAARLKEHHP